MWCFCAAESTNIDKNQRKVIKITILKTKRAPDVSKTTKISFCCCQCQILVKAFNFVFTCSIHYLQVNIWPQLTGQLGTLPSATVVSLELFADCRVLSASLKVVQC